MTHYPKKDTKTPTLANTKVCSQPYWILAQQSSNSGQPWVKRVEYKAHHREVLPKEWVRLFFNLWRTLVTIVMLSFHEFTSIKGGNIYYFAPSLPQSHPLSYVCVQLPSCIRARIITMNYTQKYVVVRD